jgi:methylmalonyl-CoA/ethylmalonyl-CoA epimerase
VEFGRGGLAGVLVDVDHVGIAVRDLEAAAGEYRKAFGIEPVHRERVEDQGVDEVLFAVGTSYIQLLGATGPDTPVGRFLERRGEGVHHIGYRVADVAEVLERLRGTGVPLVDEAPRPGSRRTTVAFVHPKGFRGVLVELVQEPSQP